MRRLVVAPAASVVAVVAVVVTIGVTIGVAAVGAQSGPDRSPVVTFVQDVPDDVVAEARTAIASFAEVFAARRDCIGGSTVVLVDVVEGGDARYDRETSTIEIEIPTTPARFRESLVHELAHHVEDSCADGHRLRTAVSTAVGGPGTPWSSQRLWADRPSEQWAEAVVALVLTERRLHGASMPLASEVMDAARSWIDRDEVSARG